MAAAVRRTLALLAAAALVGLGILAAVHMHGVTDPDRQHSSTDYFLTAQTQAGFTLALLVSLPGLAGLASLHAPGRPAFRSESFPRPSTRAPPSAL